MEKRIMKGNEALAEGAWRQKEVGGTFVQGESEIASVNMTFAARALGVRALTSTSGPGFSLYQEGIAYWVSAGVPAVAACVQRFGIGDGFISAGQDNYWQAVKGGGNGDYHLIVLAPNSVQENVDMAYESFALAEKWSHPVLILSDGTIGQMMEPCELPPFVEWAVKGVQPGKDYKVITDITYFKDIDEWNDDYLARMREISETEQRWESFEVKDADVVLVAYGISSRVAQGAVEQAREEGFKLGLIRLITLWPYPRKAFETIPDTCRGVVTVEVNMMGQMRDDVIITVKGKFPTFALATRQRIPKVDQVIEFAKAVYNGEVKEVEVF